jgi:SHS2 domain-containing protein
MGFELAYHTADLAVKAWGANLPELFQSMLDGYRFLLAGDANVEAGDSRQFSIDAPDLESLLVRFCNRLIYLFDTESFLPILAELSINGLKLEATISGTNFAGIAKHCVKAATYHGLSIVKVDGNFFATIIFDD